MGLSSCVTATLIFTLQLLLMERKLAEVHPLLTLCGTIVENWQGNPIQKESLRVFFLVLQVTHYLDAGQVEKSAWKWGRGLRLQSFTLNGWFSSLILMTILCLFCRWKASSPVWSSCSSASRPSLHSTMMRFYPATRPTSSTGCPRSTCVSLFIWWGPFCSFKIKS